MKSGLWLAMAWMTWVSALAQQVRVEVTFDRFQYLPGEELVVGVRITNFSGKELLLGREKDWLQVSVTGEDGLQVRLRSEIDLQGEFALPSSGFALKRVNLAAYYDLRRPGRYRVAAGVQVPELGLQLVSSGRHFDITTGTELWSQEVGVPSLPGSPISEGEVRRYALMKMNTAKKMQLYLCISDPAQEVFYRVVPFSTLVSFGRPEVQVDQESRLHVLNQYGAQTFLYCVFNPQGELVTRHHYQYSTTRPTLRLDADDNFVVGGGRRLPRPDDVPANPEEPNLVREGVTTAPAERK
jgi:hypothetical protein